MGNKKKNKVSGRRAEKLTNILQPQRGILLVSSSAREHSSLRGQVPNKNKKQNQRQKEGNE